MSQMFLVNTSHILSSAWKLVQYFVDDRVKAKLKFLSKADLHVLHDFIDRSLLPPELGGTRSEPVLSTRSGNQSIKIVYQTPCAMTACWQ